MNCLTHSGAKDVEGGRPGERTSRAVIRAGQTRALYRQGLTGTIGNLVVAAATVALAVPHLARWWQLAPLALVILTYFERILQVRAFTRTQADDHGLDRLRRRFLVSALVAGSCWGINALLLMPILPPSEQVFLIVVGIGLAAGGLSTLGEVLSVFLAFALPILALTLVAVLLHLDGEVELLAPLMALYILVLVKTSVVHARSLQNALELSLQNAALAARLEEASRQARAASDAKSEFLARMSHEIRTPMNGILGTTELLRDAPLPERERHLATLAHSSSELLLSLLNDVLDMARVEAGRIDLTSAPISLEAVVGDVASMFGVQADQKGLTLVCHVAREVPPAVVGDATRLRQILTNLVGNAVKFTSAGEVELHVAVEAGAAGRDLVIRVRDTGVGIPRELHSRIFNAFEQARSRAQTKIRGSGLGLAISSRLAALMGGSLAVDSEVDRGSCFTLRLPCVAPDDHAAAALWPSLVGTRVALHAPRPLEARVLAAWLGDAGAEVVAFTDPAELGATAPDAVVVDAGALGCQRLRAGLRGLPALAIERPSTPLTERCRTTAARVLPLPLRRVSVLAAVDELVHPRDVSAPAADVLPAAASGVRVLVVDDDAVNRKVASHMLDRLGAASDAVEDGEAALVAMAGGAYDLLLLDYELPDLGGDEVARRLRVSDTRGRDGRRLPVLALTAHALPEHHRRCLDAGMDGVLIKPLTVATLRAELARLGILEAPGQVDQR